MLNALLTAPGDGARLAKTVRELAREARRAFTGQLGDAEVGVLFLAINDLEDWIEATPAIDLCRWISSLKAQLEERFSAHC